MMNKKRMTKRIMMIVMAAAIAMATPMSMIADASETTNESSESKDSQPPEMPNGEKPSGEKPNGEPPAKPDGEKPSGEKPSGEKPDGEPPAKPDGGNSDNDSSSQPPEMPGGKKSDGEAQNNGEPPAGAPSGGANTQSFDYSGEYKGALTADGKEVTSDSESISTETSDENAALSQNGGTLKITNGTLKKSGSDDDGDRCNFYGVNSISLTVGEGSKTYLSDTALSADGSGSNAIFATDSGIAYANNVTIDTTADNSRGLDATYNGTIIGNGITANTDGNHCATLATDRGGGNVSVTNSTLNTNGDGSPILYSTGDIEVKNVTGTATGSQIAGMEGYNTILIYDSDLSSEITKASASDPVANGVIIYQSTSGDAETSTGETATFNAVDSTLKTAIEDGAFFYVTNTTGDIVLKNTTLDFDSTKANLLQIEGNDSNNWGSAGKNGGNVVFSAYDETLAGDISVDTISSLDFYLFDGSTYTGAMTITENANGSTSEAPITVNLSKGTKWTLTKDSVISNLNAEDGAEIVDESGKSVSIVVNGKTEVSGDSDITLTVTGEYTNNVSTDEHNELTTDFIDRSEFDEYYGTTTAFDGEEAVADETAVSLDATESASDTSADTDEKNKAADLPMILALAAGAAVVAAILGIRSKNKK